MRPVKITDYLEARDESVASLARRAGLLRSTLHEIAVGNSRPRVDIARKIVMASRDKPTTDGRTVTYEDLDPSTWDDD